MPLTINGSTKQVPDVYGSIKILNSEATAIPSFMRRIKQTIITNGKAINDGKHVFYCLGNEPIILPDGQTILSAEMDEERFKEIGLVQIDQTEHIEITEGIYLSIYKIY
jgi:hypothetical protein